MSALFIFIGIFATGIAGGELAHGNSMASLGIIGGIFVAAFGTSIR